MIQLEFFPETEQENLRREISLLKQQQDKMRKSQYAVIGELKRLLIENKEEVERLKSAICKQKDGLESWLYK